MAFSFEQALWIALIVLITLGLSRMAAGWLAASGSGALQAVGNGLGAIVG